MATISVNGVRLAYQITGPTGPPLVLVHGSWGNRRDWDRVAPAFAERCRVLAYDRRGHSESERPPGQGSIEEDAADLAALISHLDLAPAHVVGNSFGGSVALRLAARRPALFRSLAVHEPPLFALLADRPDLAPTLYTSDAGLQAVRAHLGTGNLEAGSRRFMETFVVGPGGWDRLSPDWRQTMVANAPTFLDELRDPDAYTVDLAALAAFPAPTLLTYGDQSPPFYPPVVAKLAGAVPRAELRCFAGAGHVPHASHPVDYVATIFAFAQAANGGADHRGPSVGL
jgi:pimeloyl-ACP methyl ester carboxylesterase